MRWSVTVVAEGDRVVSREEIVELADAVAASGGIASGIGTTALRRAAASSRPTTARRALELGHGRVRPGGGAGRAFRRGRSPTVGPISEADDELGDLE